MNTKIIHGKKEMGKLWNVYRRIFLKKYYQNRQIFTANPKSGLTIN